jgi:hypothetical protein
MAFGPSSISLQIRWLVVDIVSDREATLDLGGVIALLMWMGAAHTVGATN